VALMPHGMLQLHFFPGSMQHLPPPTLLSSSHTIFSSALQPLLLFCLLQAATEEKGRSQSTLEYPITPQLLLLPPLASFLSCASLLPHRLHIHYI